jgi:hypothetical protein
MGAALPPGSPRSPAPPAGSGPRGSVAVARRHAIWRWTGAFLFPMGLLLLFSAVLHRLSGGSGWDLALGFFSTATGLAAFGANHDTAMAAVLEARGAPDLPAGLQRELDEELARARGADPGLRPAPRLALAMPLVSLSAQIFLALRIFGG